MAPLLAVIRTARAAVTHATMTETTTAVAEIVTAETQAPAAVAALPTKEPLEAMPAAIRVDVGAAAATETETGTGDTDASATATTIGATDAARAPVRRTTEVTAVMNVITEIDVIALTVTPRSTDEADEMTVAVMAGETATPLPSSTKTNVIVAPFSSNSLLRV
jgi:hypothetical protein